MVTTVLFIIGFCAGASIVVIAGIFKLFLNKDLDPPRFIIITLIIAATVGTATGILTLKIIN